uniref:Carbonic anhydrase n=1 Tax=Laticauda laticaudata TaxID=8630 RepID=A0A8C5SRL6_LATLA
VIRKQLYGPSLWYKSYPIAQGSRQSPIDIISTQAIFDPSLKPLSISYGSDSSLGISNNGHSVMVDFKDVDDKTAISGGPLENPYRLKQFHFHWGTSQKSGSEHTINGKSFPCELHLVHWNAKKYTTFGEAVAAPDGLAVIGVFLEVRASNVKLPRLDTPWFLGTTQSKVPNALSSYFSHSSAQSMGVHKRNMSKCLSGILGTLTSKSHSRHLEKKGVIMTPLPF